MLFQSEKCYSLSYGICIGYRLTTVVLTFCILNTQSVHDRSVIERAKVRNAIVDGYIKCLPPVQRKLIFGPDKPPVPLVKHREGK